MLEGLLYFVNSVGEFIYSFFDFQVLQLPEAVDSPDNFFTSQDDNNLDNIEEFVINSNLNTGLTRADEYNRRCGEVEKYVNDLINNHITAPTGSIDNKQILDQNADAYKRACIMTDDELWAHVVGNNGRSFFNMSREEQRDAIKTQLFSVTNEENHLYINTTAQVENNDVGNSSNNTADVVQELSYPCVSGEDSVEGYDDKYIYESSNLTEDQKRLFNFSIHLSNQSYLVESVTSASANVDSTTNSEIYDTSDFECYEVKEQDYYFEEELESNPITAGGYTLIFKPVSVPLGVYAISLNNVSFYETKETDFYDY